MRKLVRPWLNDPRSWYQLQRWRRRRRRQLMAHPLCVLCEKIGLAVPAEVADHVVPHNGDWDMFLNGALQSLCKRCHDSDKRYIEHGRVRERHIIGVDGWPDRGNLLGIRTHESK